MRSPAMPDVTGRPSPGDVVYVKGDDRRWVVNHVGEIDPAPQFHSSLIVLVEVQEDTEHTDPFTVWVNIDRILRVTGAQVDLEEAVAWLRANRDQNNRINININKFERVFAQEYKPLVSNDA